MMKKTLACVAACSVVVGMAQGAVRFHGSGSWDMVEGVGQVEGWQGAVPGSGEDARLNWGNNVVTLDYAAPAVGNLKIGVDEGGNLVINDGGVMTSESWSGIGVTGAINASMTVNSGGTANIGSHLWMGAGPVGNFGLLEVNNGGVVNVGGNIGLGTINASTPSGGTATINVNDGGLLNLHHWSATTSIQDGSVMNVNGTGVIIVGGNRVNQANDYFAIGKIGSDLGAINAVYTADGDFTTITAIPEPATLGLMGIFGAAIYFKRRIASRR